MKISFELAWKHRTYLLLLFYNLVILIKLYKIRYLNLDKALLFPRIQAICLKNWKLWRAPNTTKFNIFRLNFAHVSYLTMSTKWCSEFFKLCLHLELLIKMQKNKYVETTSFIFLQVTQDLNKTKKIPNTLLQTLVSRKRVRRFSKKYWTLW